MTALLRQFRRIVYVCLVSCVTLGVSATSCLAQSYVVAPSSLQVRNIKPAK